MNLYLDDDYSQPVLAQMLRHARHDVRLPQELGLRGHHDPVHPRQAILMIRRDNNPKRDLSHRGIVVAIGKLEAAGAPVADEFVILNHWR